MSWLGPLFAFLGGLLGLFKDAGLRKEGATLQAAQDAAKSATETTHEVRTASDARADVERVLEREPERLRDDDGFKRPG